MTNPITLALNAHQDLPSVAVVCQGTELTYQALHQQAENVANGLRGRSWGGERLVALYMKPSIEYVIMVLAALKAGVTFLPLDENRKTDELVACLRRTRASTIVTDQFHQKNADTLLQLLADDRDQAACLVDALVAEEHPVPADPGQPSEDAYIIYTSGSTGEPKAVCVHHDGILPCIQSIVDVMDVKPEDCYAQLCALEFDASLQEILAALLAGATLKVIPSRDRKPMPRLVKALRGVTAATMVPEQLNKIDPTDLPELQVVIATGSKMRDERIKMWILRGQSHQAIRRVKRLRFINGFGATEETIGSFLGALQVDDDGQVVNHLGVPMEGMGFAFRRVDLLQAQDEADDDAAVEVDPHIIDGTILTPAKAAELAQQDSSARFELITYSTAGRPNRYFDTPPRFQKGFGRAVVDGDSRVVYYTSDMVRLDEQGRLFCVGRLGDSTKRNGKLIDLKRVEDALNAHARDCACAEVCVIHDDNNEDSPGVNTGDLVVMVRPLNDRIPVDTDQITRLAASSLMLQEMPSHVLVVKEPFPRLASKQTVDKKALKAKYDKERDRRRPIRGHEPPANDIEKEIAEVWRGVLGLPGDFVFCRDDNFLNLGASSIHIADMFDQVVGQFKLRCMKQDHPQYVGPLEFDLNRLTADATIASMARQVIQKLDPKHREAIKGAPTMLIPKPNNPEGAPYAVVLIHSLFGRDVEYVSAFWKQYERPDTAIYTINAAPFVKGSLEMPRSIEETASIYLSAVKACCRDCRILRLVGWSAGGVIVSEMLHQLQISDDPLARVSSGVMLDSYAAETWQAMSMASFYRFLRDIPVGLKLEKESSGRITKSFERGVEKAGAYLSKKRMIGLLYRAIGDNLPGRRHSGKKRAELTGHAKTMRALLNAILHYRSKPVDRLVLYKAMSNPLIDPDHINDLLHADRLFWPNPSLVVCNATAESTHGEMVKDANVRSSEYNLFRRDIGMLRYHEAICLLRARYQQTDDRAASLLLGSPTPIRLESIYSKPVLHVPSLPAPTQSLDEGVSVRKTPPRITLESLWKLSGKKVVVADKGVGKTSLLRYLAFQWACASASDSARDTVSHPDCVVLVELRKIKAYVDKFANSNVVQFLQFACRQQGVEQFEALMTAYFSSDADARPALNIAFLLDGFNEVSVFLEKPDTYEAELLLALIHVDNSIVTTQEQALRTPTLDLREDRTVLELRGLDGVTQIRSCIEKIFRLVPDLNKGNAQEDLLRWLVSDDNHHLATLEQPLMLFLFCALADDVVQLTRQCDHVSSFHHQLIFRLFKQFLVQKCEVEPTISDPEADQIISGLWGIFSEMAYQMTMLGLIDQPKPVMLERYCMTGGPHARRDAYEQFEGRLRGQLGQADPVYPIGHAENNFRQLVATGIIRSADDDRTVVFLHESIRDHFAAEYIARCWKAHPPETRPVNIQMVFKDGHKPLDRVLKKLIDKDEHVACVAQLIGLLHQQDCLAADRAVADADTSDSDAEAVDSQPAATITYGKQLFVFVVERIRAKRLCSTMDMQEKDLLQLPSALRVAVSILETCCQSSGGIEAFCEGTDFLEHFRRAVKDILFCPAVFRDELRQHVYMILKKNPLVKLVVLNPDHFHPALATSAIMVRARVSDRRLPELLKAAAEEDLPYRQTRILRTASFISTRLMFDPSLSAHSRLLRNYLHGDGDCPQRPDLVIVVVHNHIEEVVEVCLKDSSFEKSFMDLFQAVCQCVQDGVGDEGLDELMMRRACKLFDGFFEAEHRVPSIQQRILLTVMDVFLPFKVQADFLYQRKRLINPITQRILMLKILLTWLDFRKDEALIYPMFLAIIDTYRLIQIRRRHTIDVDALIRVVAPFWGQYKGVIKPRLYVADSFDRSELQQQMWGVVKFISCIGSPTDCKELFWHMMNDQMVTSGVFVGPVHLLYDRLDRARKREMLARLKRIASDSHKRFRYQDQPRLVRRNAHALIGLVHCGNYNALTVKWLYRHFKNQERLADDEKFERIYYEVLGLILEGDLEIAPEHEEKWFMTIAYKLTKAHFTSYLKDRIVSRMIDLAVQVVPKDDVQLSAFSHLLIPYLDVNQSRWVCASAIKALHFLLGERLVSRHCQDGLVYHSLNGAINVAGVVRAALGLRFESAEALVLLERPCVVEYLLGQPSEGRHASFFHELLFDLFEFFLPNSSTVSRLFSLGVIHHLLSTHAARVGGFCGLAEVMPHLTMHLYDKQMSVRLATISLMIAYGGKSLDDGGVQKALDEASQELEEAFEDLIEHGYFPGRLLRPIKSYLASSPASPGSPSQRGMFAGVSPANQFAALANTNLAAK